MKGNMYPDNLKAKSPNNWRNISFTKTLNQYRTKFKYDGMPLKKLQMKVNMPRKKKLLMVVMVLNQLNQMEKEKETILVINGKDMEHYMVI